MIQRVVMVRLDPRYRTLEDVARIVANTEDVLSRCPDVRSVSAAAAADARSRREWDFVILVQLDDLAAVERYRDDPIHRKYVDVFLKPMMDKIRVWNFERPAPAGPDRVSDS